MLLAASANHSYLHIRQHVAISCICLMTGIAPVRSQQGRLFLVPSFALTSTFFTPRSSPIDTQKCHRSLSHGWRKSYLITRRKLVSKANHSANVVDQFEQVASRVGLSESQTRSLLKLSDMLQDANTTCNLTAIDKPDEIIRKHLVDALALLPILDEERPKKIVDVGTGAGFPGLVLAIARPDWQIVLLDSVRKKLRFHEQVVNELSIGNTQSVWGRAEDLAQSDMRETFCVAIARSVAKMPALAELTLPFVRVNGCVIAQKTIDSDQLELSAASRSIKTCGGRLERIESAWPTSWPSLDHLVEVCEPHNDSLWKGNVILRKERKSPSRYPRQAGVPKKSPL